jgi:hypothetical protein
MEDHVKNVKNMANYMNLYRYPIDGSIGCIISVDPLAAKQSCNFRHITNFLVI